MKQTMRLESHARWGAAAGVSGRELMTVLNVASGASTVVSALCYVATSGCTGLLMLSVAVWLASLCGMFTIELEEGGES